MSDASILDVDGDPRALEDLADYVLGMEPEARERYMLKRTADELDVLERAMAYRRAMGWRATPVTMAHHLTKGTKGEIKLWRYSTFLGEKFRQAVTGESIRQIWNIEARYGKSLIASQWGPAWAFDYDPGLNLILSSYADTLADENADAVREILRMHADQLRCQLRRDRQRIDRFVTTGGGGLIAAGIDASISGFPGDGVILDDPFKNWAEAHSEARRNHVENQYRSVLRMRAESDDAFIIIVHNRWHQDDLSGRLIQQMQDGTGEEWDIVRLPTIAEAPDPKSDQLILRLPDPIGRQPGEVLEPERFSEEGVKARSLAIGSYLTAAMQQQRPAPEEGGEIKRAWFRIESRLPNRADEWLSSWDTKMKDKEGGSSYVVGQMWARTGKDAWLMDQLRGKWNFPTTVNAVALMAVRWPQCNQHVIEAAALGPEVKTALKTASPEYVVSDEVASALGMTDEERSAVQALRRRGLPGVMGDPPKGDKTVRARAVSPTIEAGDVHLWEHASFLGVYLDEMAAFPNGTNDDQVDATSQALAKLHRVGRHRLSGNVQRETRASV